LGKAYTYLSVALMVSSNVYGATACVSLFLGFLLLGLSANLYLPYVGPPTFDAYPYNGSQVGQGSAVCGLGGGSECTPKGLDQIRAFRNDRYGYVGAGGSIVGDRFWWVEAGVAFVVAGIVSIFAAIGKTGDVVASIYWMALFFNLMALGWAILVAAYNKAGPDPTRLVDFQYVSTGYWYSGCHPTTANASDFNAYSCSAGPQTAAAASFAFINFFVNLIIVLIVSCAASNDSGSSSSGNARPPKSTELAA